MEPRTTGFTSHSSDASDTRMEALGDDGWPALIGVGSVCRRSVLGENGLMRVLDTLEGVLPTYVMFDFICWRG